MYRSPTFWDVPDREWALKTPEALYLESQLPEVLRGALRSAFLETGLDGDAAAALFDHLSHISALTRTVKARPSDALPFEQIYRRMPTSEGVDQYFVRSKGAIGIYLRHLALTDSLPHVLRKGIVDADLGSGEKFIVLNAGSGPSHEMIDILAAHRDLSRVIKVIAVDTDDASLEIGRKRVAELQLRDSFEFRQASFTEIPSACAHMILLIGILCPLPSSLCIQVLRQIASHCLARGTIVYSTVQDVMLQGDPLLDMFMRGLSWCMDYKTDVEADRIGLRAGWQIRNVFYDALNYNRMTIARMESAVR